MVSCVLLGAELRYEDTGLAWASDNRNGVPADLEGFEFTTTLRELFCASTAQSPPSIDERYAECISRAERVFCNL
jgi:hypothetical protein